jgi:hypothetical protein
VGLSRPAGAAPPALELAWHAHGQGAAPVFSAPAPSRDGWLLLVGHVDGRVRGLRASDGAEAWAVQLQGQLFADLCVDAPGLGGACALAATHAGCVHCLSTDDGAQVRRLRCLHRRASGALPCAL